MMQPIEALDADVVRAHLTEVKESAGFRSAPRLAQFLTFIVEATLAGNSGEIKESLIAVEVYGRNPGYNPQSDSTVRVEASRLRSRLTEYYAGQPTPSPLRIEIPKGTYVPVFRVEKAPAPVRPAESPVRSPARHWLAFATAGVALILVAVGFRWAKARADGPVPVESVGVLPFVNLSGDEATGRFCASLTEEITTALAREDRQLRVAAISDRNTKAVHAVLEGSVRREGERLIVTSRLAHTSTRFYLWAERHEHPGAEAPGAHRHTSALVIARLRDVLRTGTPAHQEAGHPTAMGMYSEAEELLRIPVHKDGPPNELPPGVTRATALFREITRTNLSFARGWAGLAEAGEWEYELRGNQPRELLGEAKAAALRATELEPGLVEGWNTLTSILFFREWDLAAAAAACLRAMELEPRNTSVRQRYIDLLRAQGRAEEAWLQTIHAIQLQPAAPGFLIRRALLHLDRGNFEEALKDANSAALLTNRPPFFQKILWTQGLAYEAMGRVHDAEQSFLKALAFTPHETSNQPALGHLLARAGRTAEAEHVLSSLRAQLARRRTTWFAQAVVQTGLRRVEDALASLERGLEQRDDGLLTAAVDPRLRPLHGHPRFQRILEKLRSYSRVQRS